MTEQHNRELSKLTVGKKSAYDLAKDFGLPLVVFVIGLVVTYSQYHIEERRIERQNKREDARIERQEQFEVARKQIDILSSYRQSINNLLRGTNLKDIRNKAYNNASHHFTQAAPALTTSTLKQLNGETKGHLMQFLIDLDFLMRQGRGYSPVRLNKADLSEAHLAQANLAGATFNQANFNNANLTGANLSNSQLKNATFSGADLKGADFTGASGLTPEQLVKAKNWQSATVDKGLRELAIKVSKN